MLYGPDYYQPQSTQRRHWRWPEDWQLIVWTCVCTLTAFLAAVAAVAVYAATGGVR